MWAYMTLKLVDKPFPTYDASRDYEWNYSHPPRLDQSVAILNGDCPGRWTYAGLEAASPLAIAAGPLLNSQWLLYYASLGFDILTYKTVRRRAWGCYPMPNLVPVASQSLFSSVSEVRAQTVMRDSWAVSFGMPSRSPDVWRPDLSRCRQQLAPHQILAASVVATPESSTTPVGLAEDYAQCADWARQSGADVVELNFSCPNVATCDGQLYQQLDLAQGVLETVRAKLGPYPLLVKLGAMQAPDQVVGWIDLARTVQAGLVMINCLGAKVRVEDASSQNFYFSGAPRGIAGHATAQAVAEQFKQFAQQRKSECLSPPLIPVGGIAEASQVRTYLKGGAEAVQVATMAMLNPKWAMQIKAALAAQPC